MTLKLLKIEAEDSWSTEAAPTAPRQAPRPAAAPRPMVAQPAAPRLAAPEPAAAAPSGGVTARGLGALRRHGLLPAKAGGGAAAPAADRGRALEKARKFVDQAYAVPDGGWVEGGGLWTTDRMDRRR